MQSDGSAANPQHNEPPSSRSRVSLLLLSLLLPILIIVALWRFVPETRVAWYRIKVELGTESFAERALNDMGDLGAEGLPPLYDFLRHPDPKVRARAACAIGSTPDMGSYPPLLKVIEDPNPLVRLESICALKSIAASCPQPRTVIRALLARLDDSDEDVALYAAQCFEGRRRVPAKVHQTIAKLARSQDPYIRGESVKLVSVTALPPELAIPILRQALKDLDPDVRDNAVNQSIELGQAARPLFPALKAALKDPSFYVQNSARDALTILGAE